jgi:predicted nuclease of predicted toxin-antitoxin system
MSSSPSPKFLVDVNLPYYFSLWNSPDYVHQRDIDAGWTDEQIWNYATEHDLTIISKDADFSTRIVFHEPPPRVIHVRVGNMKIRDLFHCLTNVWKDIVELNSDHKLINIFRDRIEAIE